LLEEKHIMTICIHPSVSMRPLRTAGFTLIEILLVIVILLLLASALVVFLLPQQEGAERNTTRLLLNQVSQALDTYRLNVGRYPSEEDGGLNALLVKPNFENPRLSDRWNGPYLKPGTRIEDPWGQTLRYELVERLGDEPVSGPPYKLYSVGPDGQPETEDDVQLVREGEELTDVTTGMD
jgi:general secretion pathway protein G